MKINKNALNKTIAEMKYKEFYFKHTGIIHIILGFLCISTTLRIIIDAFTFTLYPMNRLCKIYYSE